MKTTNKTIRKIAKYLIFLLVGTLLFSMGFGVLTWQYWAIGVAMVVIGSFDTVNEAKKSASNWKPEGGRPQEQEVVTTEKEIRNKGYRHYHMDDLLDKISLHGIDSLTKDERRFLDEQNK